MTREEFLLSRLSEECIEVSFAIHKALAYGPENTIPGTIKTNLDSIEFELDDLRAVIELLCVEGVIDWDPDPKAIEKKKWRVLTSLENAKKEGTVK